MKKRWILCGVSALVFVIILVSILIGRDLFIDTSIMNIMTNLRNDTCTNIFKVVTYLGDKYIILIIVLFLAGILYIKKHKHEAFLLGLNLFNIVVLNKGIKYLVRRERPSFMLIEKDGYSFPSGHSMLTLGVYGFLIFLIYRSNIRKKYKTILSAGLTLIVLIVGYSRIYLGVHYPSDIIGGYSITIVYLTVFITVIENKFFKKS